MDYMKRIVYLSLAVIVLGSCVRNPTEPLYYEILSPDGNLNVEVVIDSTISLTLRDSLNVLVEMPDIYMKLDNGRAFGLNEVGMTGMLPLRDVNSASADRVMKTPFNRNSSALVRYSEADFIFKGYGLKIRVYNDGMAYRFFSKNISRYAVVDENARFLIHDAADMYCFASDSVMQVPVLTKCRKRGSAYAKNILVSDNDAVSYPGMKLVRDGKCLKAVFERLPWISGREKVLAYSNGKREYPWRVIGYVDDRSLLSSDLMYLLGRESRIKRTDWIKPGKAFYIGDVKDSIALYEDYIDTVSQYGFEYVLVDAGRFATDSLEKLVGYGGSKNTGVFVCVDAEDIYRDPDGFCKNMSSIGVKGLCVSGVSDDPTVFSTLGRICEAAADNSLMLELNGVHNAAGLNRTYPNLLVSSFCDRDSSENAADYFPGYIIKMWAGPVMAGVDKGTTARKVAGSIIYDSPVFVVYDNLDLADSLCMDFISSVPETFDRVYPLEIGVGKPLVTARKAGKNWYVAGVNAKDSTVYRLNLDEILAPGENYSVTLFRDACPADGSAKGYAVEKFTADSFDSLDIMMFPRGGFAMKLESVPHTVPK